jgi:hypothetical protein
VLDCFSLESALARKRKALAQRDLHLRHRLLAGIEGIDRQVHRVQGQHGVWQGAGLRWHRVHRLRLRFQARQLGIVFERNQYRLIEIQDGRHLAFILRKRRRSENEK